MGKILFLTTSTLEFFVEGGKPSGGASVQTLVWMQAFNHLGFEVFQAQHINDKRPLRKEFSWLKIAPIFDQNKTMKLMWYRYRLPYIFKVLKRFEIDYLYTSIPKWYSGYIGLMCKFLRIKNISRIASDNTVDERILINNKNKHIQKYIHFALLMSDYILPQNTYQYTKIREKFPKKKILKIPNPIIIDKRFLKIKEEYAGYIAWIANFRDVKNMGLLYEIAKRQPEEKFYIAGGRLSFREENTEKSIANLKTLNNVTFVGKLDKSEILPFLSKAKFLLNTSIFEGFSNTFLEAMVTGTPIISSSNVNPDGMIDKFKLGLVYQDEKHLKDLLVDLKEDEYFEFSKNCLQYVCENHDDIQLTKKLISFISE